MEGRRPELWTRIVRDPHSTSKRSALVLLIKTFQKSLKMITVNENAVTYTEKSFLVSIMSR